MSGHLRNAILAEKQANELLKEFKHNSLDSLIENLNSLSSELKVLIVELINEEYRKFFDLFSALDEKSSIIDSIDGAMKELKFELEVKHEPNQRKLL